MNRKALLLLFSYLWLVSAFAPHPVNVAPPRTSSTGLLAKKNDPNKNAINLRKAAASFVVASTILSNIGGPVPAARREPPGTDRSASEM